METGLTAPGKTLKVSPRTNAERQILPQPVDVNPDGIELRSMMAFEGPILIRRAALEDRDVIAELNTRLAWETERLRLDPDRIRDGVTAVLDGRGEAFYFVAEVDGAVVGQLMLTREWSDWRNGWFYWIQSVYVRETARQRGIFRRLFHAAQDWVRGQDDGVGLRLYVEEHNATALDTYRQLGLEQTGYRVMEVTYRGRLVPEE
jgi:GNAT superfamily N-acetyltransferase